MKIINGKEISVAVKEDVRAEVEILRNKGIECTLAVIIVGDDPASRIYVNNKKIEDIKDFVIDSTVRSVVIGDYK